MDGVPRSQRDVDLSATPRHPHKPEKKMRFLKVNYEPTDTYFNEWPVPMHQVSQMPKTTQEVHDNMFADDAARDAWADDGYGDALIEDVGDFVVPFPREFRSGLTRKMIHVWDVQTGVIFMPGSGQSLLAFILERKRAVGICRNAAHKTFVHENLANAVKALALAPDKRPAAPAELTRWEIHHSRRRVPKNSGPRSQPTKSGNRPLRKLHRLQSALQEQQCLYRSSARVTPCCFGKSKSKR